MSRVANTIPDATAAIHIHQQMLPLFHGNHL